MSRADLILALLASASGRSYSPAQLQKTVFLVTRNVPGLVNEGPGFDFQPYDYGPFDKAVYQEAEVLKQAGNAEIVPSPWGRWVTYAATQAGIERGEQILNGLRGETAQYLRQVSAWALSQSFSSLVKAIYDMYPEMKVNSIFKDAPA
ncbi:MAG TPA: hypothetical protein VGH23_11005 [Rhizomicrobium sp.]